jgi:hypothetical protein
VTGIALNPLTNNYFAVRESVELSDGKLYPTIAELSLNGVWEGPVNYTIVKECMFNFEVESTGKGFEGLALLPARDGDGVLLLGLCESNFCKAGNEGDERGNGRIIAASFSDSPVLDDQGNTLAECSWEPVKEIVILNSTQCLLTSEEYKRSSRTSPCVLQGSTVPFEKTR